MGIPPVKAYTISTHHNKKRSSKIADVHLYMSWVLKGNHPVASIGTTSTEGDTCEGDEYIQN